MAGPVRLLVRCSKCNESLPSYFHLESSDGNEVEVWVEPHECMVEIGSLYREGDRVLFAAIGTLPKKGTVKAAGLKVHIQWDDGSSNYVEQDSRILFRLAEGE